MVEAVQAQETSQVQRPDPNDPKGLILDGIHAACRVDQAPPRSQQMQAAAKDQ